MASKSPASTGPKARTKSPKARVSKDQKEQSERFKETARELDADESGAAFERALTKVILPRRHS